MADDPQNPFARFRKGHDGSSTAPARTGLARFRRDPALVDSSEDTPPATEGGRMEAAEVFRAPVDPSQLELGGGLLAAIRQSAGIPSPTAQRADVTATRHRPRSPASTDRLEEQPEGVPTPEPSFGTALRGLVARAGLAGSPLDVGASAIDPLLGVAEGAEQKVVDVVGRPLARLLGAEKVAAIPTAAERQAEDVRLSLAEQPTATRRTGRAAGELAASVPLYEGAAGLLGRAGLTAGTVGRALTLGTPVATPSLAEQLAEAVAERTGSKVLGSVAGGVASGAPIGAVGGALEQGLTAAGQGKPFEDVGAAAVEGGLGGAEAGAVLGGGLGLGGGLLEKFRRSMELRENQRLGNIPARGKVEVGEKAGPEWEAIEREMGAAEAAHQAETPVSRETTAKSPAEAPPAPSSPVETARPAAPEAPQAPTGAMGEMATPELDAALSEAFGADASEARSVLDAAAKPVVDRVEGGIEWHPPTPDDHLAALDALLQDPPPVNPESRYAAEAEHGDMLFDAGVRQAAGHLKRSLDAEAQLASGVGPGGRALTPKQREQLEQDAAGTRRLYEGSLRELGMAFGDDAAQTVGRGLEAQYADAPTAPAAAPAPAPKPLTAKEKAAAKKREAAKAARAPQVARAHELAAKITAGTATPDEAAAYDELSGAIRDAREFSDGNLNDSELPVGVESHGFPALNHYDLLPGPRALAELTARRERAATLPIDEASAELHAIDRDKLSISHRRRDGFEIADPLPEVDQFVDTVRLLPNVARSFEKLQGEKKPKPATEAMSPRYEVEQYGLSYMGQALEKLRGMAPDLAALAEQQIAHALGFPFHELEQRYAAVLEGKGVKATPPPKAAPAPTTPKAKRAAAAIVEAAQPELGVAGREHGKLVEGTDATGAPARFLNGKRVYREPDPANLAHDVFRDAHDVDIRIPPVGHPVYLGGRGGMATVEKASGEHVTVNTGSERISGHFMDVLDGTGGTVTPIERPVPTLELEPAPTKAKGKKAAKAPKAEPAPTVERRPKQRAQHELEAEILGELKRERHETMDALVQENADLDNAIEAEEELRDFNERLASMDDEAFVRMRARRNALEDYLRSTMAPQEYAHQLRHTEGAPAPRPRWMLTRTDDERVLAERKFDMLLQRIEAGADPTTRKNTGLRYAAYLGREAGLAPDRTAHRIFEAAPALDFPRIRRAVTEAYLDESHLPAEQRKANRIPIGHPDNPDTIGRAVGADGIQQELLEIRRALNERAADMDHAEYLRLEDRYETLERALAGQMDSAEFLAFMEQLDRMAHEALDRFLASEAGTEADAAEPLEAPADLPPVPRERPEWPFQMVGGWRPEPAPGKPLEALWQGDFEGQPITFRVRGTPNGPVELILDEGTLTDAQLARVAQLAQDRSPDTPITFRRNTERTAQAAPPREPNAALADQAPAPVGTATTLSKLPHNAGWTIKGPGGEGLVGVKTLAEAREVAQEYGWQLTDPKGKVLVEAPKSKAKAGRKGKRAADAIKGAADANLPADEPPPTDEPTITAPKVKRSLEPRDPAVVAKAYRKSDNEELLVRHHEVLERLQRAESPEQGGIIAPWTRFDDDVQEQRVGGLGFGAGKRAHRIKDDGRILTELERELERRGIPTEEVYAHYDRWIEAVQEQLGREADEKAAGMVDDDDFFGKYSDGVREAGLPPYDEKAPERIRAAAIRFFDQGTRAVRTFEGFTHYGAIEAAIEAGALPEVEADEAIEHLDFSYLEDRLGMQDGFTTTRGRFVDRAEAVDVARRAAQLKHEEDDNPFADAAELDSVQIHGLGWQQRPTDAPDLPTGLGPIGEAPDQVRERGRRPYGAPDPDAAERRRQNGADPELIAEAEFGVTESIESAAFILADGTMLDFSQGTGGRRVEDHRAINRVLPAVDETKYGAQTTGMFRFVDRGNVRVDAHRDPRPYLHAQWSRPLTAAQRRVLLGSLRDVGRAPEVILEVRLDDGDRNVARTISSATVGEVAEAIDGLEAVLAGDEPTADGYQLREPDLFGYSENLFDDADAGRARSAPMGLSAARQILEDPREVFLAEHGRPSAEYSEAKKIVDGAGSIDADEMRSRGAELRGEGFDFGPTHDAPGQDDLFGGVGETKLEPYHGRPRFYSRVARSIEAMKLDKAPAQTWLAKLKSANLSADELDRTVGPALAAAGRAQLTKADVLELYQQNDVTLQEAVRAGAPAGHLTSERTFARMASLEQGIRALGIKPTAEDDLIVRLTFAADDVGTIVQPRDEPEYVERLVRSRVGAELAKWAGRARPRPDTKAVATIEPLARDYLAAKVADVQRMAVKQPLFAQWRVPALTAAGASSNYREIVVALRTSGNRIPDPFRSQHYTEDGDYLLHLRVSDTVRPDGGKTLNVEEVQSDRHQKGRKRGYRPSRKKGEIEALTAQTQERGQEYRAALADFDRVASVIAEIEAGDGLVPPNYRETHRRAADRMDRALAAYNESLEAGGQEPAEPMGVTVADAAEARRRRDAIPDAPMKDTPEWAGLAVRRIIDEAVEGGYDRVVFANGRELAELFDIRKVLDRLSYDPEGHTLEGRTSNGDLVYEKVVPPEELPEHIGQELADRLLDSTLQTDSYHGSQYHELEGANLAVGGEGMEHFYGRILPDAVKGYAKKAGIELEVGDYPVGDEHPAALSDPLDDAPFKVNAIARDRAHAAGLGVGELYDQADDYRNGREADPELAGIFDQAAEHLEERGGENYNAADALVDALNDRLGYDDMGYADIAARHVAAVTGIDVQRKHPPRPGKGFDVTPELKAAADRGLMLYEPGAPAAEPLRAAGYDVGAMPPDRLRENAATAQDGAIAYGSSAAADRAADQIARDLGKRATATVNGIPTPATRLRFAGKKAVRRAWIDVRGQKVQTYADVHAIMRPFRSPTAERLHAILLDDNGVVLSHSMESSGAINYVATPRDWIDRIRKRAERLGATRLILSHNHPSGNPKESLNDYQFTRQIADTLAFWRANGGAKIELAGHYVIDHETGTWIGPDGTTTPVQLATPDASPDYGAGPTVRGPEDVHAIVAPVTAPGTAHVLYLNSRSVVVALEPRSIESLDQLERWLPQQRKALGASYTVIAVHDAAHAAAPGSEGPYRRVIRRINTLRRAFDAAHATAPSGLTSSTAGIYDVMNTAAATGDEGSATRQGALAEDRSSQVEPIHLARQLFEDRTPPYDGTEAPEPGRVRAPRDPMTFSLGLPDEAIDDAGVLLDAPRRARVMRALQRALGVPARTGRMGKREAAGYYKARAETIRLRTANNVEVLAHEIGHHLHKLLFGLTPKGRLSQKPLRPWAAELRPLGVGISEENGRPQLKEGFAEFVRRYITNPEAAKEKAPTFFAYFEQRLASDLADVKLVLEDARDQYALWRHASAEARFDAHISDNTKPERAPLADLWSRLRTYAIDDLEWVRRVTADLTADHIDQLTLEQDAELLARASRGAAGLGEIFLEHGVLDWHSLEVKPGSKGLKQILQPIKADFKAFRRYAMALRAIELAGHGVETGFRVPDARAIVAKYGQRPAFVQAFEDLQTWNDGLMQLLVDAGVMTPQAKANIQAKHKAYLPFYRDMEDELGVQRGTGSAFGHIFSPVKRIRGSGRDVIDPFEGLIKHAYLYTSIALRHQVSKALAAVANLEGGGRWLEEIPAPSEAMKVPLAEIFKRLHQIGVLEKIPDDVPDDVLESMLAFFRPGDYFGKENIISVLGPDGRRAWYEVDPELWKAVTAADRETVPAALKFFGAPARLLRAGATLTPEFLGRNPIRDTQQAAIYSDNGFIPYVDTVRGVFMVLGQGDLYKKWLASGAVGSNLIDLDRKALRKGIDELLDHDRVIPNVVRHPLEALRALSAIMEEGTRLGEFDRSVRRRRKAGATGRAAYVPAGQDSAEITTNFARRGAKTAAIRLMTAFWNARLQGYDRMFRAFKRHPFRSAFRAFMGITLPSLLLYWLNRKDEDYYELPRWQRDLFWMVPLGDEPGHGWIRIPKPFELGVIFGSVPERTLEWIDTHDPGGLDQLLSTFLAGELRSVAIPVPTFAQPLIDNYANWDQFRDRPIVPRSAQGLVGAEQYGGGTTSELAKGLGHYLGYSPAKIDHVLQGYGAGLGRLATDALGAVTSPRATLDDVKGTTVGNLPGVRGFTARAPGANSESVERLYDELERVERLAATADQYLKSNDPRYNDFYDQHADEIVMAPFLRDAAGELKQLRAVQQLIRSDEGLSPAEKREQLTELGVEMQRLARSALDRQLGQGVP